MDEANSPTLEAFINSSSNIPSDPKRSEILRQYADPDPSHPGEEVSGLLGAEETVHDITGRQSTALNIGNSSSRQEHLQLTNTDTGTPSTEDVSRAHDHSEAVKGAALHSGLLSPFDDYNMAASGFPLVNFTDLDSSSDDFWLFADLCSDNWVELLSSQPYEQSN